MLIAMMAALLAQTDQAAPEPAALVATQVTLVASGERLCLPDASACFAVVADTEAGSGRFRLQLTDPASITEPGVTLPLPYQAEERDTVELWPSAILLPLESAGGPHNAEWLIGIRTGTSTMYSGGGGQASRLHLHRIGIAPHAMAISGELLNVPLTGSLLIRACFGEDDSERRRGVCHDEYNYGATLTLDPADDRSGELPTLIYATQATSYPQTARRGEDSTTAPPLRASDLSHWRDPECSYTRTLRFNPATERYEMDRAGPDCSAYTVP